MPTFHALRTLILLMWALVQVAHATPLEIRTDWLDANGRLSLSDAARQTLGLTGISVAAGGSTTALPGGAFNLPIESVKAELRLLPPSVNLLQARTGDAALVFRNGLNGQQVSLNALTLDFPSRTVWADVVTHQSSLRQALFLFDVASPLALSLKGGLSLDLSLNHLRLSPASAGSFAAALGLPSFLAPVLTQIDFGTIDARVVPWFRPASVAGTVPEPATWGLWLLGLAGLLIVRRRATRAPAVAAAMAVATVWSLSVAPDARAADTASTLQLQPSTRMYWRVGLTRIQPRDRSSDARDISGPVIRQGDEFTPGLSGPYAQSLALLSANMQQDHPNDAAQQGLGIPQGVTVDAGGASGLTVQWGRYLDEARSWALEAYVLGQPFELTAHGAGRIGGQGGADAVKLGEVIRTRALGPIVYLKHVFGHRDDRWRWSVGAGGACIAFFDTRASQSLADYAGGPTKVKLQHAFGPGAFLGADWRFSEAWTLSATLGRLQLRTHATVTTQTVPAVIAASPALQQSARDVGPSTQTALQIIDGSRFGTANLVPAIAEELAQARTGSPERLGTHVRRIETEMNPWLFTLAVGRDF